ncbi:MAG: 50S ribosomal protein L15 [Candidatus Hatepunaea meridiana]|nr:50S ribosomal protein L15 [Candidatus Hatepunaea meridiana]
MHNDSGDLGNLKPAPGSIKKPKRIGRGRGSGHGDTATRGHKGAKSRAGYSRPIWFEGGQMPIHRQLPKRGFNVPNRTKYLEIKISDLEKIEGEVVNPESIRTAKLVKGHGPIVLLGNGETDRNLKVSVHRITESAREKITKAGGSIDILPLDPVDRRVKKGPIKKRKMKKNG